MYGYKPKEIENHGLVGFPPLEDAISDPKFLDRLKQATSDQLPLRAEMVHVGAWLDMTLFNHSYNPTVSLGTNDWLFLKRDVYTSGADPVPPMAEGIKRMGDAMASHGIRFVFAVVPNKSAIYPEKLDTMLARASESATSHRMEMQRLLTEAAPAYFVDLWSDLLEAKAVSPRPFYLTLDTHWNAAGAAIASKAVVDRLHEGLWDDSALVAPPPRPRLGDLSHMQGWDRWENAQALKSSRPGVLVTETQPFGADLSKDALGFKAISTGPYLIPGRAVLLHDSFFEQTKELLAPYFEQITFINEHLRERPETLELIAKSDILIVALVERNFIGVRWYYSDEYQNKIEEAIQQSVASRR